MLTSVNFSLGPRSTPQEVRDFRKQVFDFHRMYGMPVIFKHRWNNRDFKKGLVQHCPIHFNVVYNQDDADCPYCFGTGFLGGYSDGQIVWVTFSDSVEDRIRIGPQGVLLFDRQPDIVAPWVPDMGDGDLIITADFKENTFDVEDERDRYVLHDVTARTVRGFQKKVQTVEFKVQQNLSADRVPDDDILQDVPIIFDPSIVPPPDPVPPGGDPSDYPAYDTGTQIGFTVVGLTAGGTDSTEIGLSIVGLGGIDTSERSFAVVGISDGEDVSFDFGDE